MRIIAYIALAVAGVSIIAGLISRLTMTPISLAPGGVEAQTFLSFTDTALLVAITFILLEILGRK